MKVFDTPTGPVDTTGVARGRGQERVRTPARKDGASMPWHTPRDSRTTPWFGPAGWRDFADFHLGQRQRRIVAQARAVDRLLDGDAVAPEQLPRDVARLRRLMRRAFSGAPNRPRPLAHPMS